MDGALYSENYCHLLVGAQLGSKLEMYFVLMQVVYYLDRERC